MKFLTLTCIAILVAGCANHQRNEITKVELARSGAWLDWGAALSVDSTLSYKYYGRVGIKDNHYSKRYYYVGKVSPDFWDTLNRKLQEIRFKKIDSIDHKIIMDENYYELIIHWDNQTRRIVRVDAFDSSDSVLKVIKWLDKSYTKLALTKVTKPIKFETSFQNPPPGPDVDGVKFPPPVKGKRN